MPPLNRTLSLFLRRESPVSRRLNLGGAPSARSAAQVNPPASHTSYDHEAQPARCPAVPQPNPHTYHYLLPQRWPQHWTTTRHGVPRIPRHCYLSNNPTGSRMPCPCPNQTQGGSQQHPSTETSPHTQPRLMHARGPLGTTEKVGLLLARTVRKHPIGKL